MARGYVSVNGKTANGKKAYLVKGSRTYKGRKAYVVKNGRTCLSWSGTESGEMIITESGTITVPSGVTLVDIFCVGGGGGAGGWYQREEYDYEGETVRFEIYGGSGGGGYTSTVFDEPVTPGETLTVTIGAGGRTGRSYYRYVDPYNGSESYGSSGNFKDGGDGGATSVKRGSTTLCSAVGGSGGKSATLDTSNRTGGDGGDGGSGGCGGGAYAYSSVKFTDALSYAGGIDGGDGEAGGSLDNYSVAGGKGQGSTTRAFEESNGTLYSNGGDGAGTPRVLLLTVGTVRTLLSD